MVAKNPPLKWQCLSVRELVQSAKLAMELHQSSCSLSMPTQDGKNCHPLLHSTFSSLCVLPALAVREAIVKQMSDVGCVGRVPGQMQVIKHCEPEECGSHLLSAPVVRGFETFMSTLTIVLHAFSDGAAVEDAGTRSESLRPETSRRVFNCY